jgi:N utilization substance protein A
VQELRGERIDIIAWDEDPAKFVCNALQPAEIIRVLVNESDKSMEVIVPEEQLLLAIGKRGQNVKLASKLVGWQIEVRAEGHVEDALKRAEGLFAPKKTEEEAPKEEGVGAEPPAAEAGAEAADAKEEAPVVAGPEPESAPVEEGAGDAPSAEETPEEKPGDGSGA